MKFLKVNWFTLSISIIVVVFVFGLYSLFLFLHELEEYTESRRYDIVCYEKGEKVFEKRGQNRSYGYDGTWREVSIYENDKHVKDIVMSESTTCETKYYRVEQ